MSEFELNKARFRPAATEKRAKYLLYGDPGDLGDMGLLVRWTSSNLSQHPEEIPAFLQHVSRLLGNKVPLELIRTSAVELMCGKITRELLIWWCWRMAAHYHTLLTLKPLSPENELVRPIVAPLQIISVKTGWSRGKHAKPGVRMMFQVIDGELCPLCFERWFSTRFLWIFARELGVGSRRKYKYTGNKLELHGMRLLATLVPSKFDKVVTFEHFGGFQFKSYNRDLIKARQEPCPLGFKWACHKCPRGVEAETKDAKCPDAKRACRPFTLSAKFCKLCETTTAHDNDDCIPCRVRKPTRGV